MPFNTKLTQEHKDILTKIENIHDKKHKNTMKAYIMMGNNPETAYDMTNQKLQLPNEPLYKMIGRKNKRGL